MLIARPSSAPARRVGQHLHVARQHDQVDPVLVDQLEQPRLGRRLVLRRDRHVVERHVVRRREARRVLVVGHDRRDLDLQRAGAPAEQQVVEAVQVLGDQDQRAVRRACRPQLEGHVERLGDRLEVRAQRVRVHAVVGEVEHDPHEEVVGVRVDEQLALPDVARVLDQESRDLVDDPRPVGARQGEDERPSGGTRVGRQRHQSPSSARRRTTYSSSSWRIASSIGGGSYSSSFCW